MVNSKEIIQLIYKYLQADLSTAENNRLQNWVSSSRQNRRFFEQVTQKGYLFIESLEREQTDNEIDLNKAWQKTTAKGLPVAAFIEETSRVKYIQLNWKKYTVAASIIAVLFLSAYLLLVNRPIPRKRNTAQNTLSIQHSYDVSPNTRNAVLTLSDGRVIRLDSGQNGVLATQGSAKITRLSNGRILYNPSAKGGVSQDEVLFNTISVPKGGNVISLFLADGSKVWLNAASTIRYPTTFVGNERNVEITGEAYFEVAHNAQKPFVVKKGDVEVTVLGTAFNINAYREEGEIKVTLLKGSVKILQGSSKQATFIVPGQQAIASTQGNISISNNIDTEAVVAWKNGLFNFNNTSLETIMRQVERWYDVQVYYEGDIKQWTFNGQISRYSNASNVLEMMEATGTIHFRIEDRKIFVRP